MLKKILLFISITLSSITIAQEINLVPEWSKDVIWYQIFVERFRNGDTTNDPTPVDLRGAYPGFFPKGWHVTPWGQDWYQDDDYVKNITKEKDFYGNEMKSFGSKSQLRRYGGDLQGVLNQIDYLVELGVTAIYFNPLNDAPSLHKYDARHWRHIDVNFGPNPTGDKKIMASENPTDTSTWKFTEADKLFLKVIDELHKKNIKVILDYSWNHTGIEYWAWKDVVKKQEKSAYKDWYWIENFDDAATPENEFKYKGWIGVFSLPEIRETAHQDINVDGINAFEGNIYSPEVKQLIFDISKRWLDPNGDGDPSDGVDGYRLDVAGEVPLGFWREYREEIRKVNPDAYLLGEIWWEKFPETLTNPEPFLRGDVFDAVMNYRWYRATRQFFNPSEKESLSATTYAKKLEELISQITNDSNLAMMNLTSSHDAPRLSTSLFNQNAYKFNANPEADKNYKIHKPNQKTIDVQKMLLIQQFTWMGSPHIWAGDEMGMWGGDDPSNRKPLIWKDMEFEDEKAHPTNQNRPVDKVKFDDELFAFYKKLIQIRKENPVLVFGAFDFLITDDTNEILAYARLNGVDEIISVFNNSDKEQTVEIQPRDKSSKTWTHLISGEKIQLKNQKLKVTIPAKTAFIISN